MNFDKEKVDKLINETNNNTEDDNLVYFFGQYSEKPCLSKDFIELMRKTELKKRPSRTNLQQLGLTSILDKRFCNNEYIYLLRGDYQNCENGFYSYKYAFGKQTIESLLENYQVEEIYYYLTGKVSVEPLNMTKTELIAALQTKKGGACFVSTTINYEVATTFAFMKKGRVYLTKVRKDNVLRALLKVNAAYEETEYLVPDFIEGDEVIASFHYTDYIDLKEYLNYVVGLNLSDKDLIPSVYCDKNNFAYEELIGMGIELPSITNDKTDENLKKR